MEKICSECKGKAVDVLEEIDGVYYHEGYWCEKCKEYCEVE